MLKGESRVVAVIATYRREAELCRLLAELSRQTVPLHAVVVADNASDAELQMRVGRGAWRMGQTTDNPQLIYLPQVENRGCGAGLKAAEEEALQRFPELTHVWILEDDVYLKPETLEELLNKMVQAGASAVVPLTMTEEKSVQEFPEPSARTLAKSIRKKYSPEQLSSLIRRSWYQSAWCIGACLLVEAGCLKTVGTHRDDFWMLGDDLDFSLRLSRKGLLAALLDVQVGHYKRKNVEGQGRSSDAEEKTHYLRFLALLQNLSYLTRPGRDTAHLPCYLAGNFKRFFKTFGFSFKTLWHAFRVLWYGAVVGEPAGGRKGTALRERLGSP